MKTWNASKIKSLKNKTKIACLTAYDAITARLADSAGIELILVGDSLATTSLGYDTTLPATMDVMIHHSATVARTAKNAVVVGDMPFLSYQISDEQAIANAGRFLQEAGCDAVKVEGGVSRAGLIAKLVSNGIPVMAHIGLLPQSVHVAGYKSKGHDDDEVARLKADARAVEEAGAFSVVLECVTADAAAEISRELSIPTIGIGSGAGCDGQILVIADMLGMMEGQGPRFVRRFADINSIALAAIAEYKAAVEKGEYPGPEHVYKK